MSPATAGLKPPPRFVRNQWAWTHTLTRLAEQDQVDEYGNPLNYGAAIAIYKNVSRKYGPQIAELPPALEDPTVIVFQPRHALLEMQAPVWTVAHNCAWAANDTAHQRLYLQEHYRTARLGNDISVVEPMCFWRVERHTDAAVVDLPVDFDMALWLTENSPHANEWVRTRCEQLVGQLTEALGEVDLVDGTGRVREIVVMANFFDRRETKERLRIAITQVREALEDA